MCKNTLKEIMKSFCDKTGYSSYSGNHVEEKHKGVKYIVIIVTFRQEILAT